MAITPPRFNPNQEIPNAPFSSVETWSLNGPSGPLVIGTGLSVSLSGVLSSTGGGGGGGSVTSLTAGAGITLTPNPITATGTVALTPVGSAGTISYPASLTVNAFGQITASTAGAAPLVGVTATAPLTATGTTTRNVSLSTSGVTAGSYTVPSITVDSFGRITAASNGTAVTSVGTGTGLTGGPITSTGSISLANTAVTAGSYTYASFTVDAQGRLTAASNGTAPVTAVTATAPLASTGGTTPAISLSASGVAANTYTYPSITVDTFGRITAASDGAAPNTTVTPPITNTGTAVAPVIGIQTATTGQLGAVQVGTNIDVAAGVISVASASTTGAGIVQLNDTVTSNSTTEALTAKQGLALQTQINSLLAAGGLTLAGTFDAATGQLLTVTSSGAGIGFIVGNDIPAPAAGNTDYFVIVTTGGSYTPPGPGSGPYSTSQGDWLLSNGTAWQFLNVGTDLPIASTGTAGIVELADSTETQAGTDATLAVTPAGAAATYVPIADFTAKGDLLSATGANNQTALAVGNEGDILTVCAAAATGLAWAAPSFVSCSVLATKGSIITTSTPTTPVALPVGNDGEVLTACAAASTGLCWAPASTPAIPCACITGKGALVTGTAANTPVALPVGSEGDYLVVCSANATGLCWTTPPADVPCAAFTALGDILAGTGTGTYTALGRGSDGQILTANGSTGSGLAWVNAPAPAIPCSVLLNKGDILVASNTGAPSVVPVGADGLFLVACSTATNGMCWIANSGIPCSAITGKGALITGTGANNPSALSVGGDGLVLTACSASLTGLCWESLPVIARATPTVPGTVYGETSPNGTFTGLGCLVHCGAADFGAYSTLLGYKAGEFDSQGYDTAVGAFALNGTIAQGGNVALGYASVKGSGGYTTAVGHRTLQVSCSSAVGNTAVGACAGVAITFGDNNTAVGLNAGDGLTSGSYNTFVGSGAGGTITSGVRNTIVGDGIGGPSSNTGCWTGIGSSCKYAYFSIFSSDWAFTSDERLKTDITALPVSGESFVNTLRPVEFTWLDKETKEPVEGGNHCVVGFIAQDVQKSLKDAGLEHITNVVDENAEGYLTMEHTAIIPFLVKAVQELSAKVAEQGELLKKLS